MLWKMGESKYMKSSILLDLRTLWERFINNMTCKICHYYLMEHYQPTTFKHEGMKGLQIKTRLAFDRDKPRN